MSENLKKGIARFGKYLPPSAKLEDRYVGYLDFLGFSEVVRTNTTEFLEIIYSNCYNMSLINISEAPMKSRIVDGFKIATADQVNSCDCPLCAWGRTAGHAHYHPIQSGRIPSAAESGRYSTPREKAPVPIFPGVSTVSYGETVAGLVRWGQGGWLWVTALSLFQSQVGRHRHHFHYSWTKKKEYRGRRGEYAENAVHGVHGLFPFS